MDAPSVLTQRILDTHEGYEKSLDILARQHNIASVQVWQLKQETVFLPNRCSKYLFNISSIFAGTFRVEIEIITYSPPIP